MLEHNAWGKYCGKGSVERYSAGDRSKAVQYECNFLVGPIPNQPPSVIPVGNLECRSSAYSMVSTALFLGYVLDTIEILDPLPSFLPSRVSNDKFERYACK